MDFEKWIHELKRVSVEVFGFDENFVDNFDLEIFTKYYNQGLTPTEAWKQEVIN